MARRFRLVVVDAAHYYISFVMQSEVDYLDVMFRRPIIVIIAHYIDPYYVYPSNMKYILDAKPPAQLITSHGLTHPL
jgi:hypothetical protein